MTLSRFAKGLDRSPIGRYAHWLHTMWPAGTVEKLPEVRSGGATNVPGLYITGDLTGIPLLKFSADSGARAVQAILADPAFKPGVIESDMEKSGGKGAEGDVLDLVIVGGGVSGMSAAMEARQAGLNFTVLEANKPFATIVDFPTGKPIYTYPTDMVPAGQIQFKATIKEALVEELYAQTLGQGLETVQAHAERVRRRGGLLEVELSGGEAIKARRVIVGIGRSGNFRSLGVPGEAMDKVFNRLHDPKDFCAKRVLIVGGGDSALEAAIALATCGSQVTLSYRKAQFSRPKPENVAQIERLLAGDTTHRAAVEHPSSERVTTAAGDFMDTPPVVGSLRLMMPSQVSAIREGEVTLKNAEGEEETLINDAVFSMIGREAPLGFFRRSGVRIRGEWTARSYVSFALILLAAVFVFHWKKGGVFLPVNELFARQGWFPFNVPAWWGGLGEAFNHPANLLGTLKVSLGEPGFYYSVAYCLAVGLFGLARVRRRKTPYVAVQTATLAAIQIIPLFLLPFILLPWAGYNGWFEAGAMRTIADQLFPEAGYGHGREYWRAFGLILAWPLFIWNVFTAQPLWGWLAISFLQTFVIIPAIIYKWGKGAYCGWICSCGALAETMGDAHRQKMPHGPLWNRMNMIGQVFLFAAFFLLVARSLAWVWPGSIFGAAFALFFKNIPALNYVWFVDLLWAGIIGVGFYWHFSGRVWCRFACPLAALMHIYARFTRFRILADKKKCISCNVCTAVCHQGIDIMNFANKGLPMADPECVRCSACVQSCPTGVLSFGEVDRTGKVLGRDRLAASPVQMAEAKAKAP